MLFLTGNQLSSSSHSVLFTRIHLACFPFQHLKAGSERWPWIRQGLRRGWGPMGWCRLPAETVVWDVPVGGLYLSANGVSLQTALWYFLEFSHRSFLGARWENSTVFQNSWPLGDETPPAWIIKAQRLFRKVNMNPCMGKKESPGDSP